MYKRLLEKYDQMTEEEVWKEYKENPSQEVKEYLVRKYAPLVKYVAGKLAIGLPNIDFEDLMDYGTFGLLDAIEKYDPEKGVKFKTYAITRIRGAIIDHIRQVDWVPRSIRQKAKEIESTIAELELKLGRPAEDEEIAEALGVSVEEFHKLLLEINKANTIVSSLDELRRVGKDNEEVAAIDIVKSDEETTNPEEIAIRQEVREMIEEALHSLPEREKNVLILYYYEDLTLKEIGEVLNVTESRVSQLHAKALVRLRAKLGDKIKTYLEK